MPTVGRLKDGEMLIAGEYNERLPTITQGLICHFPFDGNGGTFDLVGGFQPIQHTTGNLNLVEAMDLDWRNPSSWTYASGSQSTVTWDANKQALRIQGNHYMWLKTPIVVDYNKTYVISAEVYQENNEPSSTSSTRLYLGGNGLDVAGAKYTTYYDYSILNGGILPLGEWQTFSVTRTGTGNYPTGWTFNTLCYQYYFGGFFNYYGSSNAVIYIRNISIIVTDEDNSNCTFTNDGIAVEEATTNASLMDGQNGTTPWVGDGTPTLSIIDSSITFRGRKVARMKVGTSGNCYIYGGGKLSTSTSATQWTFSCYVRRANGFTLSSLSGYLYVNGNTNYAGNLTSLTAVEDGWYKATVTLTGLVSGYPILAGLYRFNNGDEILLADWQVEAKAFATSFVNGSRSTGTLSIPPSLYNSLTNWTVTLEARPNQPTKSSIGLFDFRWTGTGIPILFFIYNGNLNCYYIDGANVNSGYTPIAPVSNVENFHRYTLTYDGTTLNGYQDGNLLFTKITALGNSASQLAMIGYDKGASPPQGNVVIKNFSIFNKTLTIDEVKKLSNSKLSIESDGDIKQITVKESPAIPSDVYYFPLTLNGKDRYGVISPQTDTNVVYSKEGAWIGTAVTNLANVSDFTYWINIGNGNDLPDGITRLQSDVPVYGMTCTAAGSIGCYGGEATISPSSAYSMGVDAYYSSCTTGNPYAREWRTSAPGGTNAAYLEYQTKDAVGTIIPQNKWVNIMYQNITAAADASTVRYSAYITNAGEKLYFTRPMIVSRPFLPPFVNGSRGASNLTFNLNSTIGLDWNGSWSLVYWKNPIGTDVNSLTGYNIESIGCGGNSAGGGFAFFGKAMTTNNLLNYCSSGDTSNTPHYTFTSYFNKYHMCSIIKNGTTVTLKHWGIDGTIISKSFTMGTVVSNYFVSQYGYDLKLGGYSNGSPPNSYYKDLVVAKRALTDTELTTIYNTQMRAYNSNSILLIRNGINETNNL